MSSFSKQGIQAQVQVEGSGEPNAGAVLEGEAGDDVAEDGVGKIADVVRTLPFFCCWHSPLPLPFPFLLAPATVPTAELEWLRGGGRRMVAVGIEELGFFLFQKTAKYKVPLCSARTTLPWAGQPATSAPALRSFGRPAVLRRGAVTIRRGRQESHGRNATDCDGANVQRARRC